VQDNDVQMNDNGMQNATVITFQSKHLHAPVRSFNTSHTQQHLHTSVQEIALRTRHMLLALQAITKTHVFYLAPWQSWHPRPSPSWSQH